jgi:osmoprotectant transport system permease protein
MKLACLLLAATGLIGEDPSPTVRVGSKTFTESVILGEIGRQLLGDARIPTRHLRELGGTQILFHALEAGELDIYPEYTGTITGEILAGKNIRGEEALRAALAERGVGMSRSLGFNDTYAIGMGDDVAARLRIRRLSDLRGHPELKFGFSNEFMERADGWPGLRERYRLPQRNVRGLDHALAYRALVSGQIDATELYSTDAEIRAYRLRVLDDDEHFFPSYECVWLYRTDLPSRVPAALAALARLEGRITATDMAMMNARAKIDRESEERIAADFVAEKFGVEANVLAEGRLRRLLRRLVEHLALVGVSLAAAIVVAIPLGIIAARRPRLGSVILASTGVVQTIPSLALLVFMIPWLGLGAAPALAALFLYSLLPIVRNTENGLRDITPSLRESAEALGLPPFARLLQIELPLSSRAILAGIKTAAVINVGTATIGALIGAGGFGQPIVSGLRRDDVPMILFEGAIPAAVLALTVQGLFDLAERFLVPRGLRT